MAKHEQKPIAIECEKTFYLSLEDISTSFGISTKAIIDIIDEGIIPAPEDNQDEWQFDNEACRRIRIVLQLNQDLGVNLAGAALALELLNEIERLNSLLHHQKIS